MAAADKVKRRDFLKRSAATAFALALPASGSAEPAAMLRRRIPATSEEIPVIGLGTSHEFDRLPPGGTEQLKAVLTTLVEQGGSLIDTSPLYGDSELKLGGFFDELDLHEAIFMSTKIRASGVQAGLRSMERSQTLLGKNPLDLIMVHSLLDVDTQLKNLQQWKEAGRVRYIGITTSRSGGHERMESLIRSGGLDFVQVNYSPFETEADERVIPAAADHGVAVMTNRAFGNGAYFRRTRGHNLPAWAADFDCESWAQFSLKFVLGNADVSCALAATSSPQHVLDNARAGIGRLPDAATRARIVQHLRTL